MSDKKESKKTKLQQEKEKYAVIDNDDQLPNYQDQEGEQSSDN